jgi:hypothetical protein
VSKFHVQGQLTIYVDYTDEEDWLAGTAVQAINSMREWLIEEHHLRGLDRDDYDITLTAEPVEDAAVPS